MSSRLTWDQVQEYKKNGILVVPNFLTQSEVKMLRSRILDLVDEMDPSEHRGVFSTTSHDQVRVMSARVLIS